MSELICFFDTETTGLPLFKSPSDHPDQPHIVDICALLYTPDGVLVDSFEAMVRPDGWVIPNEVAGKRWALDFVQALGSSIRREPVRTKAIADLTRYAAQQPSSVASGVKIVIDLLKEAG